MASGVKWIKITTDIFDDENILMIENMPSADSIIVVWFKLLTLAGKQNNDGVFLMSNRIAYTDEMLASIFRRDLNTVRLALSTFQQFGMIEIIDDVITIPNWNKHQTLDSYEKRKERDRIYQLERRARQRALIESTDPSTDASTDSSSDSRLSSAFQNKTKKENEEQEYTTPISPSKGTVDSCQDIADLYNSICVSFPSIRSLSDARKKAIKARLKSYSVDDFKAVFQNAESSAFLKGQNSRNWIATFDWLIKDSNFAKVLDGNYNEQSRRATNSANLDYGEENEEMPF